MATKARKKSAPASRKPKPKYLPDPVYITEDEQDVLAILRAEGEPTITFEDYLREHGYDLED